MRLSAEGRPYEPPLFSWTLETRVGPAQGSEAAVFDQAIESLLEHLVKLRVENLVRDGGPIHLVIASYNPQESPVSRIAFRFYTPLLLRDSGKTREKNLSDGLLRLRRGLAASQYTRDLRIYPRCTPAAALRTGTVFHRASGFAVRCLQDVRQGREMWDLDDSAAAEWNGEVELLGHPSPAEPSELHLLVSVSSAVGADYGRWYEHAGKPGKAIEVRPAGGPTRESIASAAHAVAWARAVHQAIRRYSFEVDDRGIRRPAPIRMFIAAPTALSVAIGRELNATGRILAMDRDKDTASYVESFDFWA